jgi:lipid-A-disaccharide synthase
VRERYGLTPYAEYLALLPGSRPQEVEQHLKPMALATGLVRAERGALDARLILAPSLDRKTRDAAARLALALGVSTLEAPASAVLPAFDVALAASGTVTLECAAAGVPPVVVYKTGMFTHLLAKRLVKTPHIALPNILLDEAAFPELIQERVTPELIAEQSTRMLEERSEFVERCRRVRSALLSSPSPESSRNSHRVLADISNERPSQRVARLLEPWLARDEQQLRP